MGGRGRWVEGIRCLCVGIGVGLAYGGDVVRDCVD